MPAAAAPTSTFPDSHAFAEALCYFVSSALSEKKDFIRVNGQKISLTNAQTWLGTWTVKNHLNLPDSGLQSASSLNQLAIAIRKDHLRLQNLQFGSNLPSEEVLGQTNLSSVRLQQNARGSDELLTPVINSIDPTDKLNLLAQKNYVNQQITQKAQEFLDQNLPQNISPEARARIIQTASQNISNYAIKDLASQPLLNDEVYSSAVKRALTKAVHNVSQTHRGFANLTANPQLTDDLVKTIHRSVDSTEIKKSAKAAYKLDHLPVEKSPVPQNNQELAQIILAGEEQIAGRNQKDVENILNDLTGKVTDKNHPLLSDQLIDQAIDRTLNSQPDPDPVKQQLALRFQKQRTLIRQRVKQDYNFLPQKTLFNPYIPTIDAKTYQQAANLKVNPLALQYAKVGFTPDVPEIKANQFLVEELKNIQALIDNPQAVDSLAGKFTAAALKPEVFVAQKFRFPFYQAHQKVLAKTNQALDKPYQFYQTINQTYHGFKKDYQDFKKTNPLGWVIAPRFRAQLAWFNFAQGTKTKLTTLASKSKFLQKTYNTYQNAKTKLQTFTSRWSLKGLRKRFVGWAAQKTSQGLLKLSTKVASKTLKKILVEASAAVIGTSSIIGIPLVVLGVAKDIGLGLFKKLGQKIKKQKTAQDLAGLGAKALQAIIGGLKALGALVLGTAGGLVGSIGGALLGAAIGSAIAPGIGTVIGALTGFFAGGFIGTAIGALVGYSWMGIVFGISSFLVGPTGIFTALTGATASTIAGTAAGTGVLGVGASSIFTNFQMSNTSLPFSDPMTPIATQSGQLADICPTDCNPNPTNVDMTGVEAKFNDLAARWIGSPNDNPRVDLYSQVVSQSLAAGVDPIFTLAIWLHETGASNYGGICYRFGNNDPSASACQRAQDFGINLTSKETVYTDLGKTITTDNFDQQLQTFLGLPSYYYNTCQSALSQGYCPWEIFGAMYTSNGSCTPTSSSNGYVEGILNIYSLLAPHQLTPCYPIAIPYYP